jgi:Fe2+ transport system protein B
MATATMRLSAVAGPRARVSLRRASRATTAPARRGARLARRAGETSTEPTAEPASMTDRAVSYTSDLKEMGMSMPIIRRNVAGPKNDLKALQVYQDALAGKLPEDEDEIARLEKVLDELNAIRLDKAEEELFWAEREGQVVSAITDNASGLSESDKSEVANMVANITMYGVQGAVWNAMILLIVFVSIVNFLR